MASQTTNVRKSRPLSESQLAARRASAQKSTGPKTPEGKARSSQNALKHGFFAQTALLYYESPEDFVALRDAYLAEYSPQGPTEVHFVMEMANAQYRLRRVRGMEADLIQKLITRDLPARGLSTGEIQAEALRTLADSSHVLLLLQRYEVMFRRQYERALRLLWEHRDRVRRLAPSRASRRQSSREPSPEALQTLQAIHSLLLAPTPDPSAAPANTGVASAADSSPRPLVHNIQSPFSDGCPPEPISGSPMSSPPAAPGLPSQPAILRNEPKPAPSPAEAAASPTPNRRLAPPKARPRR